MKMSMYINEIKDIFTVNRPNRFSDACDMFLANIDRAGDPTAVYHYDGAEQLDYKALKAHRDELAGSKNALVAYYEAHRDACNALYKAGKRVELKNLVASAC